MSLKTDYKDDILAVGNLRKYQMIQNNDGTVSFQDVTQYEQTGDVFGAGDINRTNQAVNEKFDSGDVVDPMLTTEPGFAADAYQTKLQFDAQNKKLGGVTFGIDKDGNYGYIKEGADTVTPFKKGYEDTPATATAEQITEGFTAWVNGVLIVGTRPAPDVTYDAEYGGISCAKYATVTVTIYFEKEFKTVPTVSNVTTNNPQRLTINSVFNVTTKSFDVTMTSSSSGNYNGNIIVYYTVSGKLKEG